MLPKTLANTREIFERPECRAVILSEGLVPDIVRETHLGRLYWDGMTARTRDGNRRSFGVNSPNRMHLELKRLAVDGYWGNLKSVILSWHRYSLLRDAIDGRIRGGAISAALWWPPNHGERR